jgi:hypothetical protein
LVSTIVYTALPPGVYVALPSLLVIASATSLSSVSTSLAIADAPLAASVAVAVLVIEAAVIALANCTGIVNASVPPGAIDAPLAFAPGAPGAPETVPHDDPGLAEHVADALSVTPLGKASARRTSTAEDGPALLATTV